MITLKIIFYIIILNLFTLLDLFYDTRSDQSENPVMIFNGENLEGWTGSLQNWRVEDGQLIGATRSKKDPDRALWIVTEEKYEDFELTLWVKLDGDGNRNSGVYYRGEWNDQGQVVGYEFDIGGWGGEKELWWGELHDPYRRDMWITLLKKEEVIKLYNKRGWNHVRIRVEGSHVQHWLNGVKIVDWHEKDASIQKVGFIGFQLHNESKFEVRLRDISLIQIK
jgi:predicted RNA binding protein YcfA (HicA-like mRNA interferase family)